MPSVLTEEQRREYHENGFVVAHAMYLPAEIRYHAPQDIPDDTARAT
ncbi:MAG: hypothetical protein WD767_15720 [Alphaproteobacteria bacterium]